jgi:hypothetical protein
MPFQSLHNLPRLQIPKPNFMILTSTSDPLSTRVTKPRCDAVFAKGLNTHNNWPTIHIESLLYDASNLLWGA